MTWGRHLISLGLICTLAATAAEKKPDFTRHTLLVAALGTEPTGGYSVSIHSVVEYPSSIMVNVVALSPAKDCVLTMAATHPIALILIAKTSKPVQFSTTRAELTCN